MNNSSHSSEIATITGIVVPVAWASSGKIICVAVSTFDEKEYRIAEHEALNQWLDYLNKAISLKGRPYQRGNEQWITVEDFRISETIPPGDLKKR